MKEQIEQAIAAVSITKKSQRIPSESAVPTLDQSKLSTARYMPDLSNRRVGTISLAWNKLN